MNQRPNYNSKTVRFLKADIMENLLDPRFENGFLDDTENTRNRRKKCIN